jgi:hypothetical protein
LKLLTLHFISEGHGTKNWHGCFPRNLVIMLDYNSKIEASKTSQWVLYRLSIELEECINRERNKKHHVGIYQLVGDLNY